MQTFTKVTQIGQIVWRVNVELFVNLTSVESITFDVLANDEIDARNIAIAFSAAKQANDDLKHSNLPAFDANRSAFIYTDNPTYLEYLKFRPVAKEFEYAQHLFFHLDGLQKRFKLRFTLGEQKQIGESNKAFWRQFYLGDMQ